MEFRFMEYHEMQFFTLKTEYSYESKDRFCMYYVETADVFTVL